MHNRRLKFCLNFGFVFGGEKMTFDEVYPFLVSGHTIKRFCYHKGFQSYWFFKNNNGRIQYRLPLVTTWEDYYFEKIDFTSNNWEVVCNEELEQMGYETKFYEFM